MIALMRMMTVGRTVSTAAHPTTMPDDMGYDQWRHMREWSTLIAAEQNAYYALVHGGVCKHRRHLLMAFVVHVKCNFYSYYTTTPQCRLFKI